MNQYDLDQLGFKLVSQVWVDSGQIMIVDPCYVLPDGRDGGDYAPKPNGTSLATYDALLQYYDETGHYDTEQKTPDQERQGVDPWGVGLGYVTSSGYGDGAYNVYARYTDGSDGWGKRVAQVLVDFIGLEDDEDDEGIVYDDEA